LVLPGFNTDFKYQGLVYHAQTEDNGEQNPVVVSHLYLKGAILASKKTFYGHLLEGGDYQGELMEMMKAQHRHVMKEVLAGSFDSKDADKILEKQSVETAERAAAGRSSLPVPRSLDEAIMEFLDNFEGGVTERK